MRIECVVAGTTAARAPPARPPALAVAAQAPQPCPHLVLVVGVQSCMRGLVDSKRATALRQLPRPPALGSRRWRCVSLSTGWDDDDGKDAARGLTRGLGTMYEMVTANAKILEGKSSAGARKPPLELRTVELPLEPLTADAFAPFGYVCAASAAKQTQYVPGLYTTWKAPFTASSSASLLYIRYEDRPPSFTAVERHYDVTQAFLPVCGNRSIIVVAPPTSASIVAPEPSELRAFLAGGDQGVVWHEL